MGRGRTQRLLLWTAISILPAVFVRLELCPVLSRCAPESTVQAAADAPCHQAPGSEKSNHENHSPSCCRDIHPVEIQTAKISVPVTVDVLLVFESNEGGPDTTPVLASFLESVPSYPADPPLFRSYRSLLI